MVFWLRVAEHYETCDCYIMLLISRKERKQRWQFNPVSKPYPWLKPTLASFSSNYLRETQKYKYGVLTSNLLPRTLPSQSSACSHLQWEKSTLKLKILSQVKEKYKECNKASRRMDSFIMAKHTMIRSKISVIFS